MLVKGAPGIKKNNYEMFLAGQSKYNDGSV